MKKFLLPALAFFARHFLFVVFAMVAACVLWTLAYAVLLIVAVLGDYGIGGPLALPAGLVTVLAACLLLGWGVFAPACAAGATFCALFKLPRIAAIPVVFAAACLLAYLLYWAFIRHLTTHGMPAASTIMKNSAIYLSVPLGIYWWLTEGPGALFELFRRWLRKHL